MEKKSIRYQLKYGILATAAAKYSDYFLKLIVTAILARLITPAEFGVVAVVSVLLSFFQLLGQAGIGPAVIQYKDFEEEAISSLFSLSVLFGLVLALFFAASTPLIAKFYNNSIYLRLTPVLSISMVANVLLVVPQSLMLKRRRFGTLGLISIVAHIVSSGAAILMALRGFGVYALLVKDVAATLLIFITVFFASGIKLKLIFSREVIDKVFSYSVFQLLAECVNNVSRNLDKLLIGRYMGAESLGYYEKSYRLMILPLQTLVHVITPVLHPVLSQIQDDNKRLFKGFLLITRFLAMIGFPLSAFLVFTSGELILLIFGPQWEPSVFVFSILAYSVGLQMIVSTSGSIFQAAGKTNLLFISWFLNSVSIVVAVLFGLRLKSTENVATALVCSYLINFFQGTAMVVVAALRQKYTDFLKNLALPIFSGILLYGTLFILLKTVDITGYNIIEKLVAKIGISCVVFCLIIAISGEWRKYVRKSSKDKMK